MRRVLARSVQVVLLTALAAASGFGEDDSVLLRSIRPMPSRTYNWVLPAEPNRPSLPLPHFEQETILPNHIRFDTIPMTPMMPENLRPWHLEDPMIRMNALVRDENIMPQHLLDAPLAPPKPPRLGHVKIAKPYAGSMIFLPALPPPTDLHRALPVFENAMPLPQHRQLLGW